MKKVIGLVIALLIMVSMLSMGTWAFLSDKETSANNIMTAGTLDLIPSTNGTGPAGKYTVTPGGNWVNGNVAFQKMLPGDSGNVTWTLVNSGSLPGTLAISSTVTFTENGSNEIETVVTGNNGGGDGDLDQYMGVKLQRGVGTDQANAESLFSYILGDVSNYVPFSGLQTILNAQSVAVAASGGNDTVVYKLSWEIGSLFGSVNQNIIQSDTAQIDITFTLNQ